MQRNTQRSIRSAFLSLAALSIFAVPLAAAQDLLLCTFNVYKLGAVDPKYDSPLEIADDEELPQRIQNIANVLAERQFDLICLQEVYSGDRGDAVIEDLVQALDTLHGRRYRYLLSEGIGQGLIPEAIAFLYDPQTVQPVLLESNGEFTDNIPIAGRDLVRSYWVAGDFDFTLIAAHLAWGNRDDRDAGYSKVAEILTDPLSFSDDEDIVIVGDFNRFGKGYSSVDFLDHDPGEFFVPNVQCFDPDVHEIKAVTVASITGLGIPDDEPQRLSTTVAQNRYAYDMVLFTPDVAEEYSAFDQPGTLGEHFGILYFDELGWPGHQPGAEQLAHDDLKEAYSDHRPLYLKFRTDTGTPDRPTDPSPGGAMFVGTAAGKRFHLRDCWTIRDSEITEEWATSAEAEADRRPCGICKPLDAP